MDNEKLADLLIKNESIKDIPAIYVLRVAIAVLEIIASGECLFKLEDL